MKGFLSTFIAILLLTSCNDIFDTHPYDIDFHSETGINARQIAKIESRFANKDTLRGGLSSAIPTAGILTLRMR